MKKFGYVLTSKTGSSSIKDNLSLLASKFCSRINLVNENGSIPLRELSKARRMNLQTGNRVLVTVEGRDEEAAVAAVQNFFLTRM